jgi:predicted permease
MPVKRSFGLPRTPERDVHDELDFHFASRIDDLRAKGLSAEEARRAAELEFGDVHRVREELTSSTRRRAARRGRIDVLSALADDAVFVGRSIRRAKGFATMIAITMGLGIGAAAAVYGVIDRLLLRGPTHVVSPASLRRVYAHVRSKASGEFTTGTLPYAAYVALRDHARSITAAGAYTVQEMRVGRGIDAPSARVGSATADFFPLLRVVPARGRFFTSSEALPSGGVRVVVLDYGYWLREFGGAESAIGNALTIGGDQYTIVGIAPNGFTGAELRPVDLWIPESAAFHSRDDWPVTWRAQWLSIVLRVKPNLSPKQIDDDITATFRASYGGSDEVWRKADLSARDIGFTNVGKPRDETVIARWLGVVAALLLLIAIANAANLLTTRMMRRHREVAVRMALGIGRERLIRVLMLESLGYAILGCIAGTVLAYVGGETMRRFLLPSIAWDTAPLNVRVLGFALIVMAVVAVAVGSAPLPHLWRMSAGETLRGGSSIQSVRGSRMRRVLLTAQMAVSVALLIGAGLFVRSLVNIRRVDLGVEPERVLVARVASPELPSFARTAAEREQAANAWRELQEKIATAPGVEHAALAIGSPFGQGFGVDVRVPGRDTLPSAPGGGPYVSAVGPEYFATTGTRILRGRGFTPADASASPRVAVINETMASLLWPGENAIGKCIVVNNEPCATIVGVAVNARRFAIQESRSMQYYVPFGQESGISGPVLLVRVTGDARRFVQTLRRTIRTAMPNATSLNVASMQDRVDPQIRPWRLGATIFTLFGVLALIVAGVGLYSVIAYSTAQRKREFGIRVAVGASGGHLTRIVLVEGIQIAIVGALLGIAAAMAFGGRISPLLFNVSATDPSVIGVVAIVLVLVALVASLVPAVNASRSILSMCCAQNERPGPRHA